MVYIFLADGFEEVEALCPLDLLLRAGIGVKSVGIGPKREIVGSHGIHVLADISEDDFNDASPEMVILPGGMPGTKNLEASSVVKRAIDDTSRSSGYIAAICAAPSILGKMGLLRGKEAICFSGFEKYLDGATLSSKRVVRDGKVITAAGMGVALPFGLELISALAGREKADRIADQIMFG